MEGLIMPDAPEKLTVTDTGIAPYIYFEGAPNFGFTNGIINVTLAATRHLLRDGAPVRDVVWPTLRGLFTACAVPF
jgi:hypothetical protein